MILTDNINLIKFKAEAILRREIMESGCFNFTDLADKMSKQIINICNYILKNEN